MAGQTAGLDSLNFDYHLVRLGGTALHESGYSAGLDLEVKDGAVTDVTPGPGQCGCYSLRSVQGFYSTTYPTSCGLVICPQ